MKSEELNQTFEKFWSDIRGFNLYAGQPSNRQSELAVAMAREAVRLATEAANADLLLQAHDMLRYGLTANEQADEALPYYNLVIAGYEARGNQARVSRVRVGFVEALLRSGRYADAFSVAHVAERWLKDHGDNDGYARLCTGVANAYSRLGQHQRSSEYYAVAARVFEEIGDRAALAKVYLSLAYALYRLDQYEQSDAMYEKAEQTAREMRLDALEEQAKYNRAYLHYLRGLYSQALQGFSRIRRQLTSSPRHIALCDLDEAEIYLQLNLPKEAATLARRAIEECNRIGMRCEEAKARTFFGVALMRLRRFDEALDIFRAARKGFEDEGNDYWIALLDIHAADVHLALQHYNDARLLAAEAKRLFETLGIPSCRMLSFALLVRIAIALNDVTTAEEHLAQMSAIIDETRMPLLVFPYYMLCGQVAEIKKVWKEAERAYRLAAEDLEEHHTRLQHDDLKVTFLEGRNQVYEALTRLNLDAEEESVSAAFSWCERAKSRSLVELLAQSLPSVPARTDNALLRRIEHLREELNVHYMRCKPESRSRKAVKNFDVIVAKEREIAHALRETATEDSEYASLQQVHAAGLEEVQEFLPDRTTLIEYFITQQELIAFVISPRTARAVRRLALTGYVRALYEKLSFQLDNFLLGRGFITSHSAQILEVTTHYLQALHKALVEPLLGEVTTPHIVIVPHGFLHHLPFHAFYDGSRYLCDRFEITYAPSASVLRYCIKKTDVADARPLIVGVADTNAPRVDFEVSALQNIFPESTVLSGERANREGFSQAAQRASFVHVATHAAYRRDNPMFSSFKLADGYVTALDLFSMNCQANLVTLSGCQSGLGQIADSDDLLGLTRGFLYAGARSLLMSLWTVSDESTVTLMSAFYKEWRAGATRAKALQNAMQTVRVAYPNPFYWAPFVLIGKT
ncbi:MAG TPA: CHAT domain-containing tetratricopeptide repeat protein [Terriglobia bacterium]|jgi:CHAT domain-containing protein